LKQCHYAVADVPLDTRYAPVNNTSEPIRNHFVAFVPMLGDTFEIDPMKPAPIKRDTWRAGTPWAESAARALQSKYHGQHAEALGCLIALVPAN